jgi:hypothetical protein
VGLCEHGNEPIGSKKKKGEESDDYLSDYLCLTKDSSLLSMLTGY